MQFLGQLFQINVGQKRLHRFGAHTSLEIIFIFLTVIAVFLFAENLVLDQRRLTGIGDNIRRKIKHLFEDPWADIQQQTHAGRDTLEIPDVGNGSGQLNVAHALATHLGAGNFHAAAVADLAFEADLFVLSAMAFPILGGAENALTVQSASGFYS